MTSGPSPHGQAVRAKLTRILGTEKGEHLFIELTNELSMTDVTTPNDVMRIAGALAGRGGMLALIGDSLTVHARLHGAQSRG